MLRASKSLHYTKQFIKYFFRNYSDLSTKIDNIRNIGILAHIDAGKTTTTERMLFYSGTIKSMGEVHHGNTVTDFMEQERQRGITITSAAVSFPWREARINLIDTPGHIDFTMEVEQSLAVLDGAVVVLDASAGVEAQTLTVWHQADGYHVPRLLYLNKMDRCDANEMHCLKSIQEKLNVSPLMLHLPIIHNGKFVGIVNLVTMEETVWTPGRGKSYTTQTLTETHGPKWEKAMTNHRELIDTLSSIDDELAEKIITQESLENIDRSLIKSAIRRCTINMKAYPVLCGSSYKNIGVQSLMDAIVDFLPSPLECNSLYKSFGADLAARAFKVQHDDQRGVLTYLRLYSGEVGKGQKIYNLKRDAGDQTGSVYEALADEYKLVEKITAGNIAVVTSLKETMPGDLVTSSKAAAKKARSRLASQLQASNDDEVDLLLLPSARQKIIGSELTADEKADLLLGIGTTVPEPVFMCSIEPPSAAFQSALETALEELQREDPSLRVTYDEESGQIILAGMGELHLEIIKERIIREYKIEVELGPLQIAYRETLVGEAKQTLEVDKRIGSIRNQVKVTMSVRPEKGVTGSHVLRFDKTAESAANLAHLHPRHEAAVRQGVAAALLHGPKLNCPVIDVQVALHWLEIGRGTSDTIVTSAVVQCLRKAFKEAGSTMLEPVMWLEVVCPESYSSRLLTDLAVRRADIHHVQLRNTNKVIECHAPLAELLGYSSTLRALSSGLATFTMAYNEHRHMSPARERQAIHAVTGF